MSGKKVGNTMGPFKMSSYLLALRPWSFSASFIPVVLGAVLCWKTTGHFSFMLLVLTIIAVLGVHAAGNLVNTYYDFMKGVDSVISDDRTLVDHLLTPKEVVKLGVVSYSISSLALVFLVGFSSAKMEHLSLLFFGGLSGSFLYTGGIGLKYYGLGDVVIVITFGPLAVLFSYLIQCGSVALFPLFYAIPIALSTEAILHSNNTRDMNADRRAGAVTLAIVLGHQLSYVLYCLLLLTPYVICVVLSVNLSVRFFIPLLTLTMAFRLERSFRERKLLSLPRQTAKLNLYFGLLYIFSCSIVPSLPQF
ncbi:PREDICTED: ubiA prenyltransferase domain-containing protein 1-like [Acropora digitifera]|uniref:ubiA prenyltransferase domain-containing protein 1-like n=1 Tax=Acropora digitifera TaxID=70779 RepID=UPI00077AA3F0|nr:PREDICTED: ubiA prenyltransferase domain-containing protein 1-like [Acropora digitifera]